jgi:polyisoprenoid-binding protein YceI
MMKKVFLPLLIIIIIASAGFTSINSTVTRSAITFQTKNMGIGVSGTVGGLLADVLFNPANLAASTITASVDPSTINTDNSSRDEHLKGEDFFDVPHFPKITMKSVSFKHKSGNNYSGLFNLTIKGKTKQLEIPFSYIPKGNTGTFKGSFKMNRLDFGIGDTSLVLSDDVTVNIEVEVGD